LARMAGAWVRWAIGAILSRGGTKAGAAALR
jgi:hypothetical protein